MSKRYYLPLLILTFFYANSCFKSGKSKYSLMDLGSEIEVFAENETKSILQKYDDWKHQEYFGIDVSHYQGDVVDLMNSQDSLHFIICKATEGSVYVDPDFLNNWKTIKSKGFIRGAYHFYRFDDDPTAQADHFVKHIMDIDYSDIAPIVDVEEGSLSKSIDTQKIHDDLQTFLNHVEESLKRKPIIYSNTSFANQYLTKSSFGEYRLWLADYTKKQPQIPNTWKEKGYLIWQKNADYHEFSVTTDFDVFNGKLNELVR